MLTNETRNKANDAGLDLEEIASQLSNELGSKMKESEFATLNKAAGILIRLVDDHGTADQIPQEAS